MTVSTTTYKNTYTGDGADTTFDFDFQITDETDLVVQVVNSSGTLQTQILNTDYTVSGIGNTSGSTDYTSGTVTFGTAPADTYTVIVKRAVALTQSQNYVENDRFPAESHEDALDRLQLQIQDLQEQLDRCFKVDYTASDATDYTLPTPVANYYLRFNSAENGLEAVEAAPVAGIDEWVDDVSPQAGGDVNLNGNRIIETGSNNITIEPDTGEIRLNAATVTVEQDIVHLGDTDTKFTFGTNSITAAAGATTGWNINASGLQVGSTGARVTTITTDSSFSTASDTEIPTANAIKTYITNTTIAGSAPVLAGDLDTDGYKIITNDSNEDIELDPHGSGSIILRADTGGTLQLPANIRYISDADTNITIATDSYIFKTAATTRFTINNSGITIGSGAAVTTVLDEDTMSSDSATALATQQSIKAYVDNKSATQAQQEVGTVTTSYVSPGVQQYHPSSAKGWAVITTTGTAAIDTDYNVTSITDNGTGDFTVTWDTDFSSSDYVIVVTAQETSTGVQAWVNTKAAGSCDIYTSDSTGTLGDTDKLHIVAFGDQ